MEQGIYDHFGFPKKDLSNFQEARTDNNFEYHCPYCGELVPEVYEDEGYKIDGEEYPQFYNERIWCTPDGGCHDWTELYKCKKCGQLYTLENGCL